jgi:serine/threonine protein kinase
MAPEVFRENDYGQLADIFSFGVVLYHTITFEMPFSSGSKPLSVLTYELNISKPILFPSRVSLDPAWEGLIKLCLRCLEMDSYQRPSAKQLKAELFALDIDV